MTVQHIVLCRIKPGAEATFDLLMSGLADLAPRLAMKDMYFGKDTSPEGLGRGYSHGFTIAFPSIEARDIYLKDADHQAIGAQLLNICVGGVDGLLVIDL